MISYFGLLFIGKQRVSFDNSMRDSLKLLLNALVDRIKHLYTNMNIWTPTVCV